MARFARLTSCTAADIAAAFARSEFQPINPGVTPVRQTLEISETGMSLHGYGAEALDMLPALNRAIASPQNPLHSKGATMKVRP